MEKMEKTSLPIRLLLSFGITDEVFAMSMTDKKINKLTPAFFAGLSLFSYLSWNVGSALGILFSSILPSIVSKSLGVSLYAMFIGLLVPNTKKSIRLLCVVIMTMVVNWVLNQFLSSSLSILISTLGCALIGMCFISKEDLQWNLRYWFYFFVYQHIYLECCQPCLWRRFKYRERLIYSCNWFLIRPWRPWFFQLYYPAILYVDKNIWIGIIASVVAVIAALKKLPVIGVVLVSVISCVIFYMLMLS